MCCLLSGGHLLIEDIPGVGKTTLSHTLAKLMGLEYQRIQFTSDLLPADIIGATIYNSEQHQFSFHQGALFNQMILADEINRATPKAQSALLEAMEERQVTVEGKTLILKDSLIPYNLENEDEMYEVCSTFKYQATPDSLSFKKWVEQQVR